MIAVSAPCKRPAKGSVVAPWDRGDRRGSSVWSPWGCNGIKCAPWHGVLGDPTASSGDVTAISRRSLGALGDPTAHTSAFWVFLARRIVAVRTPPWCDRGCKPPYTTIIRGKAMKGLKKKQWQISEFQFPKPYFPPFCLDKYRNQANTTYFSVVVCLRCLSHHILSFIAYTFRENRDFVFITIVQFMMSSNIIRLFVHNTISLSSLCKLIWRHWTCLSD